MAAPNVTYAATTVPTNRGDPLDKLEILMATKASTEDEEEVPAVDEEEEGAVAYSGTSQVALKQQTRDRYRPNRSALR
jgi:hypothetical protein